jgi:hypothetical protein
MFEITDKVFWSRLLISDAKSNIQNWYEELMPVEKPPEF